MHLIYLRVNVNNCLTTHTFALYWPPMQEENTFKTTINARCSEELRTALERLATKEKRSLANYVRIVLEKHAQAEGELVGAEEATARA